MLGALMVFGLPIGDTLLTLARRWRNQRPLMRGDRSHFYDQLIDRGMSVRQVVRISYVLTTGFAAAGCSAIFIPTRYLGLMVVGLLFAGAMAVGALGMVRLERPADSSPERGK